MRVVIQKVIQASVQIDNKIINSIGKGLVLFLGITQEDSQKDILYLCNKILQIRIFEDQNGKMNFSLKEVKGDILLISQFTLYANTAKGNRPSFLAAARPAIAKPLYEDFINTLTMLAEGYVRTGEFGADMKVMLVNDGPVTIIIDSKERDQP
jgi:D-tyrosyl-tRNA(Tyr) deacylase